MPSRRWLLLNAVLCWLSKFAFGASDRMLAPPLIRRFYSSNRRYLLVIKSVDKWASSRCRAEFSSPSRGVAGTLWRRDLPQPFGPRFAMIANSGVCAFVDVWQAQSTDWAIALLDAQGKLLRSYTTADVIRVTGASEDAVLDAAAPGLGWWLAGKPRFAPNGASIHAPILNGTITVLLADGSISFRPAAKIHV